MNHIIQEDIETIVAGVGPEAERLAGKTILISGGAGFLGSYFLRFFQSLNQHLLSEPCQVISVDNYITSVSDQSNDLQDKNIMNVWADVANPLPIRQDLNYIIHAAGLASPVYYMKYPLETIESAVTGAKNLLELARRNQLASFLFFSSSEIYGDPHPDAVPTPESYHGHVSSIGPRACYDESKRLAETLCTIYHQHYNVPATFVRPFNVFGPGMKHNDRRVVPMFSYQALNGQELSVHGDGHQTRTFCYITDAMIGFLKTLLICRPGEAYNIGNSDNELSMKDLAALMTELIPESGGYKTIPYPSTYPAGEPQRRCPDLTKAAQHLSYQSRVDLKAGLARFIAWARTQESYVGERARTAAANQVAASA
jgi:UDP-glucuronate decarboxylase